MTYIFATDCMGLSSFKFFWCGLQNASFLPLCISAIHGYPRSLILVPIKSVYVTSY